VCVCHMDKSVSQNAFSGCERKNTLNVRAAHLVLRIGVHGSDLQEVEGHLHLKAAEEEEDGGPHGDAHGSYKRDALQLRSYWSYIFRFI